MVAAVVSDGAVTKAGVLNRGGERDALSPVAAGQLAGVAAGHGPVTRDLDRLGRYRVIATTGRQSGNTLVVGVSMRGVRQTLTRVALIFAVVTALALLAATAVGVLIIRRALAPLNRVAAAAGAVANLPLDRGEVALPVRVNQTDTNPNTEVGRLGLAVNRMLDHISAALSTRQASESRVRQFVADASHELRTPLAAIRGYTELAQRNRAEVPADVAHAMSRVESEAQRMTRLVEDLLLLARLDSGRPLERRPVDLARLCADLVSDAHAAGPDHHWNLDVPPEPLLVSGDDARLHQVVANLLANARVHTPAGTTVTLSLSSDGDTAILRVMDDGPGIPAVLQPEVFERFARADTARSHVDGSTGLGLAIVSAVVEAHHGTIALRSAPGNTEFTVRLPLMTD
jgi:two-component system OmpR family sensor kinase